MKTKIAALALVWVVFLGMVAWRVAGSGTIESLAQTVKCGAGQCPRWRSRELSAAGIRERERWGNTPLGRRRWAGSPQYFLW